MAFFDERKYVMRKAGMPAFLMSTSILLALSAFYCFFRGVGAISSDMQGSFFALGMEGLFFSAVLMIKSCDEGRYFFEPFSIVSFVYILMLYVAPVVQFSQGEVSRYGVDVSRYCIPATIIAVVSYLAFMVGYSVKMPARIGFGMRDKKESPLFSSLSKPVSDRVAKLAFGMWAAAYVLSFAHEVLNGYSPLYVLTAGFGDVGANDLVEDKFAFLAYFKFALMGSWLILFAFGNGRIVKIATFVLTAGIVFFGGNRISLLMLLLAPVVYTFASRKKAPSLIAAGGFLLGLLVLFAVVQVARVGIAGGEGFDIAGYTLNTLFEPFIAEVDDYKSYYVLLGVVPERHDYLLGSQMIVYSLVLLIPRAIWPGKPYPDVYELVRLSFGDQAVKNGVAYPALGEYYVEFGVIGCVVLMFIFGFICSRLKRLYLKGGLRSLSVCIYSLMFPALVQIVIRGYFPQNFTMLLFVLLPFFVAYRFIRTCAPGAAKEKRA